MTAAMRPGKRISTSGDDRQRGPQGGRLLCAALPRGPHHFVSGLAGSKTTCWAAWCSFPLDPISFVDRLIYPLGVMAVVAIARRFAEAVEGLLNPMEIGLAGGPSRLEGITVRWPPEDGYPGGFLPGQHVAACARARELYQA